MKKRKRAASLPKRSKASRPEKIGVSDAPVSVSSAWERLKAAPVPPQLPLEPAVVRREAGPGLPGMPWNREVIPGKCTCKDRRLEDGSKLNPWTFGHAYWCSMFLVSCPDCGQQSGTHTRECVFWEEHPDLSPF